MEIMDQQERQLALDASQSFIVQAPAGSGKTELLTQRFLVLLAHVDKNPEEIIALTFTKKAANEMRTRIVLALQKGLQPKPEQAHAQVTWQLAQQVLTKDEQMQWDLLKNPNRLRIMTIDSLCASLNRQMPILSRFGAEPNITDDALSYYQLAVAELLQQIADDLPWSQSIGDLLLHLDNDFARLESLMIEMLKCRDQWLPHLTNNCLDRDYLESVLLQIRENTIAQVFDHLTSDDINTICSCAHFAANQCRVLEQESVIQYCLDITELPNHTDEENNCWLGIAELFLTKTDTWRKTINKRQGFPAASSATHAEDKALFTQMKKEMSDLLLKYQDNADLLQVFAQIRLLPPGHYNDKQWHIITALLSILPVLAAQLKVIFRQYGVVDFIEVSSAALSALGHHDNPTELALHLDHKIKHLLVDEFQDTSYSQYHLLQSLTAGWQANDGRTLFLVGDPMQSIYRFRQAEVGLFMQTQIHGLADVKLKPLHLTSNFRSQPQVVNWVNDTFSQIFPHMENIASGAVPYHYSQPVKDEQDSAEVEYHPIFVEADEQQDESDTMIKLIKQSKQTNPDGTIAILVRARSHLFNIIELLNKENIAYRAIDIEQLTERQVIQDLLALTKAILHLGDRIAWLSLLRQPWCGLTLNDIYLIANNQPHGCIWQTMEKWPDIQGLSEDAQIRLQRIVPILAGAIDTRLRCPLRQLLENTWLQLAGPACLNLNKDLADSEAFFQLIDDVSKADSITDFDHLQQRLDYLFANPDPNADNSLQIMTIHKSKGLEFDTVILPGLGKKGNLDAQSLLTWLEVTQADGHEDLILGPIKAFSDEQDSIYQYIRKQQAQKAYYESQRLFYVAATRAKKQLHLICSVKHTIEKGLRSPASGSVLQLLWPMIEETISTQYKQYCQQEANSIEELSTQAISQYRRTKQIWQQKLTNMVNDSSTSHGKPSLVIVDHTAKHIGTVTHRYLQALAEAKVDHDIAYVKSQIHTISNGLAILGVHEHKLAQASKQVVQSLINTLQDKRGQWILAHHQHSQCEYDLSMIVDDEVQHISLDRTFVDEHNIRWIIDYKTATPHNMDHAQFINEQMQQYQQQLNQYAKAMSALEQREIRLALYFPSCGLWHEWAYETAVEE